MSNQNHKATKNLGAENEKHDRICDGIAFNPKQTWPNLPSTGAPGFNCLTHNLVYTRINTRSAPRADLLVATQFKDKPWFKRANPKPNSALSDTMVMV